MRAQPWLGNGFLAVWGPSRGGELALLLGATFPDINAVSAWVPSGIMFWPIGLAENDDPRPPASWTFRGKQVLADIAMRRLESNGFRFPFQHLKYEGAGHLILLPYGPRTTHIISFKAEGFSCLLYTQGDTPRTDAEAGADAWHRMLQFLEASAKDRK